MIRVVHTTSYELKFRYTKASPFKLRPPWNLKLTILQQQKSEQSDWVTLFESEKGLNEIVLNQVIQPTWVICGFLTDAQCILIVVWKLRKSIDFDKFIWIVSEKIIIHSFKINPIWTVRYFWVHLYFIEPQVARIIIIYKHNLSFTLTTLTMILSVENNCLLVLPNDVGNLSVLQQANFNNNQIHYIPPAIKGCQELRILGGFRKKDFVFNFGYRFPSNRPFLSQNDWTKWFVE